MTFAFHKGRYGVKLAETSAEIAQCQCLRHLCFHGAKGLDAEPLDQQCSHIMVAGPQGLVATCRVLVIKRNFDMSYSAQRYDIEDLKSHGPFLEIGRFCVTPGLLDADILRLIWGALTRMVDDFGVKFLFGCASFPGVKVESCAAGLGVLARRFQAPKNMTIRQKSKSVLPLSEFENAPGNGLSQMPTLLRSYLSMGGWVSDHAVVDAEMNTIHVFCALEIAKIPAARARALRAIAS